MKTPLPRRFGIALLSLVICAFLFRGQVSTALITRGDDYFQKGRPVQARVYYARALFFDASSTLAADRYAFAGLELRTPEAIRTSILAASQTLAREPNDANLLQDRGLLYQAERNYPRARTDFARAATITHDPRWYHLAAWAAYRSGDPAAARRLWNEALRNDPGFQPARLALAKTRLALR
jgi:tetratricopeptide (TPR) repeat protein